MLLVWLRFEVNTRVIATSMLFKRDRLLENKLLTFNQEVDASSQASQQQHQEDAPEQSVAPTLCPLRPLVGLTHVIGGAIFVVHEATVMAEWLWLRK